MKFFILSLVFLFFGCSLKEVNINDPCSSDFKKEKKTPHVDKVAQLMSVINQCPEKVWPNLALHKRPYVVNEQGNEYIIVTHPPHCSKPVYHHPDFKLLKELQKIISFGDVLIDGKPSMAIKTVFLFLHKKKLRAKRDFKSLIHEAFHHIDQNLWPVKKSIKERFTQKREMDCTPRKYRALVRYYLKEALKNSSKVAKRP